MRLGAPVFNHHDAESWAEAHVQKGLSAAYWPLPEGVSAEREAQYVAAARRHNIVLAEVGVWNNLLARDAQTREKNLRHAIARLETAERIGARCCVNIAGSCAEQWDGPHPMNYAEETFQEIVRITREILRAVQPVRTCYTLECMPWAYPWDAQSMARLLEAVDHPAFAVHVDLVNMVNAMDKVYHTGALTQAFFERFGPLIRSVHAKDFVLLGTLTLHIEEALPGMGQFDLDALLRACAALGDVPVMAEHLPGEAAYDQAIAALRDRAVALGIPFELPIA